MYAVCSYVICIISMESMYYVYAVCWDDDANRMSYPPQNILCQRRKLHSAVRLVEWYYRLADL